MESRHAHTHLKVEEVSISRLQVLEVSLWLDLIAVSLQTIHLQLLGCC